MSDGPHNNGPLREIVSVSIHIGYARETLSCGHTPTVPVGRLGAKRRRCLDCLAAIVALEELKEAVTDA